MHHRDAAEVDLQLFAGWASRHAREPDDDRSDPRTIEISKAKRALNYRGENLLGILARRAT
jgi:hypothetical protein